jgi:hypothetical protein
VREAKGKSQLENSAGFICDGFHLDVISLSYALAVAIVVCMRYS